MFVGSAFLGCARTPPLGGVLAFSVLFCATHKHGEKGGFGVLLMCKVTGAGHFRGAAAHADSRGCLSHGLQQFENRMVTELGVCGQFSCRTSLLQEKCWHTSKFCHLFLYKGPIGKASTTRKKWTQDKKHIWRGTEGTSCSTMQLQRHSWCIGY